MPLYTYQCKKCNHQFDVIQKITDGPILQCPICGDIVEKIIVSSPPFILNGVNWAKDNYGLKGNSK